MTGDERTRLAVVQLKLRRSISTLLPKELFSDPAWDLLLELFVADAFGKRLTGGDVGRRHGIFPSVMSRYLIILTDRGLLIGDGTGNLDDQLTLSGKAMESLERVLEMACDLRMPLGANDEI